MNLKREGLSTEEIAKRLTLSVKVVESYLPYSRGTYLETKTADARDCKNYRERKKNAANRQVKMQKMNQQRRNREMEQDFTNETQVYKLFLELETEEENLPVLRLYGRAKKGITRTILAPSTMQLNRLNYAIQKCFGWENSHLHHFELSDERFDQITAANLDGWEEMAGVYFRCYDAMDNNSDLYYLDDYDGRRSFKNWLKRKYSTPYVYDPQGEKEDTIRRLASKIKIRESTYWADLEKRCPDGTIRKKTEADDLHYTLVAYGGMELLERLDLKEAFELDECLFYEYDYGDGWRVKIRRMASYDSRDIISQASVGETFAEPNEVTMKGNPQDPVSYVRKTLAPVCLEADGLPVFDDVGGPDGYCAFLKGLHGEENDREHSPLSIEWAMSLGWNGRMSRPENIL